MPATDRLHGTLDALVLKSLTLGPRHGFGILRWIADRTDGVVQVEEGSLYPALYRMERDGWLDATWGVTDQGRRAKFYAITPKGRRRLDSETRDLATFISAIAPVLLPAWASR
jgi:PadR family transcriptional regulator, regulatory protein PadR